MLSHKMHKKIHKKHLCNQVSLRIEQLHIVGKNMLRILNPGTGRDSGAHNWVEFCITTV